MTSSLLLFLLLAEALALDVAVTGPALPGETLTLTVTGADPSETVHLVRVLGARHGALSASSGGLCLDLDATRAALIAQVATDATGTGSTTLTLPATLPIGAELWVQATAVRGVGGVDSVKSDPAPVTILDPADADGDGFDPTVDCDDFDAEVFPGALEICDGRDNDCDGATTEDGLVSHSGVNYATISDAVTFAPTGDVVSICPGTYVETVLVDREMTLLGVGGADVTILDGDQATVRVLDLTGPDIVVEGLTITNGADGGVVARSPGAILRHSVVTGHDAVGNGGGIWGTSMVIEDVEISHNTSGSKGGGLSGTDFVLTDVRFIDNVADVAGGAVSLTGFGLSATVTDCTFHGNEALTGGVQFSDGGAIHVHEDSDDLVVVNSDFGVGATENLPTDIWLSGSLGTSVGYTTFQDEESFTCDVSSTPKTCQ